MSNAKKPHRRNPQGLLFSSISSKRKRDPSSSTSTSAPGTRIQPQPSPKKTVKTRILILSDTHGHSSLPYPLSPSLSIDLAIHCGDLSQFGSLEDYQNTLDLLTSIPAPLKLVIPGNHDLTLDPSFPSLYAQARELWTGNRAKEAGIALLDDGHHSLTLENGARLKLYASSSTPYPAGVDGSGWAFGYKSCLDLYNPPGSGIWYSQALGTERMVIEDGKEIDVLMTHGPARYRLDGTREGERIGCANLFRAVRRWRPRVHCFGHCHFGYGAERVRWMNGREREELPRDDDGEDGIVSVRKEEGRVEGGVMWVEVGGEEREETVFVNAALMGEEGLDNFPWVVELELEIAGAEEGKGR